ncbi:hypothetical protein Tco_0925553 [Tanacetum coccineum]|uniref:Uncharacterized protein n=1 Tax=Tanacetum coccineum TaxID=301880 RepID=A0ABQ5D8A6_9ASTR
MEWKLCDSRWYSNGDQIKLDLDQKWVLPVSMPTKYVANDWCPNVNLLRLVRTGQLYIATCLLCSGTRLRPIEKAPQDDADYAGCKDTFMSTSGWSSILGVKLNDVSLSFAGAQVPFCLAISLQTGSTTQEQNTSLSVPVHKGHVEMLEMGTIETYFVKTDLQLADTSSPKLFQ